MCISDNIIKHYLRNIYFINGTAYAGKSTMCSMLAEKFGLIHCEENYKLDELLSIVTLEDQPNLNYFHTKKDWQKFLNRTPDEYAEWILGNSCESAEFEVAELIRISANNKVIVDTNIPCELLKRLTNYNQVAIMLSPQSMSVERFFDRNDPEKQFLLSQINEAVNPEKAMQNFQNCLEKINSQKVYDEWLNSGFFTLVRENCETDTRIETLTTLAEHFRF